MVVIDSIGESDNLRFGLQRQVLPQYVVRLVVDESACTQQSEMGIGGLRLSPDAIVLLEEELVDEPSQLLGDTCEGRPGRDHSHGGGFVRHCGDRVVGQSCPASRRRRRSKVREGRNNARRTFEESGRK